MIGLGLVAVLAVAGAQQAPAPQAPPVMQSQAGSLVIHGELSSLAVTYPAQQDARELRARAVLEISSAPRSWLRLRFDAVAEGLMADRSGRVDDATAAVRDAWAEVRLKDVEVRAGYGRVVWGRLDEVMPSDVINPINAATFFLEGRADARLPVAFVRSRVFLEAETSVETVLALPGNRGRFDRLDEATSPFNLLKDVVLPAGVSQGTALLREEPPSNWQNLQGGIRVSTTAGRVDMSVSAWRGFESFGRVSFEPEVLPGAGPAPLVVGRLIERYPRFTMVAWDAETARGSWAFRGEIAGFVDKSLDGPMGPVRGKAVDAGVGVDRSAGNYHLFGSLVWHREWSEGLPSATRDYVNVIASVDRRFLQERYLVRLFGVLNPEDRAGFLRGLASWSVRDDVLLEASGGVFLGEGADAIGRFSGRDFAFVRVRYHF